MAARRFLVVGHTQSTDPRLPLDDLTGAAGRLDVVARAVTVALCVSHGVRQDTEVWCALPGRSMSGEAPRLVRFDGSAVRSLNPDERSTAALLRKAFAADVVPDGHFEPVHPGIDAALLAPGAALRRFADAGPILMLDRAGTDLRRMPDAWVHDPAGPPGFVLSDHLPFTEVEREELRRLARGVVATGPLWLQGHQVVALVHDELDRR